MDETVRAHGLGVRAVLAIAALMGCREPDSASSRDESAQPRVEPALSRAARAVLQGWQHGELLNEAHLASGARQALERANGGDAGLEPADAGVPATDEAPAADAGFDANAAVNADAGADDGALHPGAGGTTQPAAPLAADIVARSRLAFHGVANGEPLSTRGAWQRLRHSRAICLGELHDNPFHHNLQRRVLERLARWQHAHPERRGELAIGYEMFQRPFQQPLSAFVSGALSEASFLEQTQYAARWGADLALYRPLFEANREQRLPALALNAATELTRAIGREGLASLTPELRAQLPELVLDDAEHREHIFGLFGLAPDDPAAASLENVYLAQVTWDETMAQTASEWLAGDPGRRVLAFAGTAHCHESAIPRRVTRRTGIEMLSAAAVLRSELEAFPDDSSGYELLLVLED